MGCFTACFGSSKNHTKTKKPGIITPPKDQSLSESREINEALLCIQHNVQEFKIASPVKFVAEIKDESEKQLNCSAKKEVTFGLNVKLSEKCQVQEDTANLLGENDEKAKREDSKDEVVQALLCSGEKGEEEVEREQIKDEAEADLLSDSSVSSLFTYPTNNRYQNCTSTDDECVDMDFNKGNSSDEVDGKNDEIDSHYKNNNRSEDCTLVQEESSESLFSISIESRKQKSAVEIGEKEVSSPLKPFADKDMDKQNARDRSQYVHSVLNPIENLSQWKAVRAKTTSSLKDQEKENFDLEQENEMPFCEEPSFKQSHEQRSRRISNRPKDDEIAVDTSLSSWLMESEKSPATGNSPGSVGNSSSKRTKSPKSFEDRPILGALTVEELKQMSKSFSPSPRKSPSYSPDEMPIIGTVGSYWRHTGEAMDAKSRSSSKETSGHSSMSKHCRKGGRNGQSTPFQTRLERVLDGAMAQV